MTTISTYFHRTGNRSLDLINYRYNERGWLTDINDVMRERWETPYEICQGEAGEEETSQQEEKVPLSELLELLCKGESVAVQGADPCAQGDCMDELADRIIDIRHEVALGGPRPTVTLKLHSIYLGDTPISLPRLPYRWDFGPAGLSQNDSLALLSDLSVWLQNTGYRFDSLQLRLLPPDWNQKSSTVGLRLSIRQTNLSLSYAMYSVNNQTPYSRVTARKENIRFVACRAIPRPEQEPRIMGLAQSTSQLQYPTALYRVRMDNSSTPVWRFGGELVTAGQNYGRELRIPVQNAQERFSILMNGDSTAVVWTLAQLLTQRQQNGLSGVASIERVIEKNNTNPCTLPPLNCSEKQTEQQNAALAQIQNLLCSTNAAQLSYPITLYQVALCNGGTAYILGQQQLQMLPQPVQIIAQLSITGPDHAFKVVVTRRRPLFAMKFRYEPNGNISELQWKVTRQDVKYYENDYDPINRLLGSNYGIEREVQPATGAAYIERVNTQDYNEFGIEYDPIGNIKKLSRRGLIPAGDCFTPGLIDNLTYSYGEEGRLTAVSDAALEPYRQQGFKHDAGGGPQATHYLYDHNGNMTSDAHKNMQFDYNFLNLPLNITTPQGTLHFLYDATGRKWAKSGPDGIRFYAGNIEYLNGQIQHIAFPDGRLVAEYNTSGTSVTSYRAEYFRTDHLGNTRLTFSDFNQDGLISWKLPANGPAAQESEITSENHYYPFGLGQKGPWYASVAPENKYRYNGKEWNEDWGLNMYDYGARGYMPDLGRWGGVDALAEVVMDHSPYEYTFSNPLSYNDPTGMMGQSVGADGLTNEQWIEANRMGANPEMIAGFQQENKNKEKLFSSRGSTDPKTGGWQELTRGDLMDYAVSLGHPRKMSTTALGDLFENIFFIWMIKTRAAAAKATNFTWNRTKIDDSSTRNTIPDFTARAYVQAFGWIDLYTIYEAKSSQPGTIITLGSFHGQTKGHIDNMVAKHSAIIKYIQQYGDRFNPFASPSVTFVTTSGVIISPEVRGYANTRGVSIEHISAQFRIRNGVWEFHFGF